MVTSENPELLIQLAGQVGVALAGRGWMLATAESCTGGWVAECVTGIAGSSAWFDRGFVTYSNAAKVEVLGVDPRLIEAWGAVSEPVVRAMAAGALRHSQAGLALAVSGIAGPAGGTAEKPVGTVWLAWQGQGREGVTRCARFSGNRHAVREQAVLAALRGIIEQCEA